MIETLSAGTMAKAIEYCCSNHQEREEKRIHDIRGLAIILHEQYCEDEKCDWKNEDWFNLDINHHKGDYYDKAEKVYNNFNQDLHATKKFFEMIQLCPKAGKMIFHTL